LVGEVIDPCRNPNHRLLILLRAFGRYLRHSLASIFPWPASNGKDSLSLRREIRREERNRTAKLRWPQALALSTVRIVWQPEGASIRPPAFSLFIPFG